MALDILHDNWGPYTHTEVENALKAYLSVLENRINQAIQSGGVGMADLSAEVQALLNKANTALQPENIAAWAKAQNKPGYTVSEITGVEGFQNLLAKLQDMDQKIQAAAQSGSDITQQDIDDAVAAAVAALVDSAPGTLDTLKELAAALGNDANFAATIAAQLATKISGIKANGASTTLPVDPNGVVELPPAGSTISPADTAPQMDGTASVGSSAKYAREDHVHPHDTTKLSKSDVSVETQGDGTVDINVGSGANKDTYTINLNHTHEDMAKLVKCTEATLPQTLADDTIYVQVDNLTTPTEIEALHIFGLEFTGGGAAPGTPRLTSPSQSQISNGIDIGNTTSGVATYLLNIKARDLTQSLLVEWGSGSTGYSFDTSNLPTGVTYDSGTGKLTITKEAACGINGVDIVVVYTGSDTDEDASGTLGISSSSVDGINVEVTLVVNKVTYEDLAGVKLTGTQWMQTDYYPNTNTEFTLECKFTPNANTPLINNVGNAILRCAYDTSTNERFTVHIAGASSSYANGAYQIFFMIKAGSENQKTLDFGPIDKHNEFVADHAIVSYTKGSSYGTFGFNGGTPRTVQSPLADTNLTAPMMIGKHPTNGPFGRWDLTIYELKITENGTVVRDWVPKKKNGVTGLLDIATNGTGTFLSSETAKTSGLASDELVAIPLPNNS